MHQITGKTLVGFLLALTTAFLWGVLPIALKILLEVFTVNTITAIRFFVAAIMVGVWLGMRGKLPALALLKQKNIAGLMAIAVVGLILNYGFYLSGLNNLTAETAQTMIQLAPFLMMLGGIIIFKERLLFWQRIGAGLLVIGLLLFFNERLVTLLLQASSETLGVIFIIIAAVTWAAYALAQKQLLVHYSSKQIMYFIYVAGTLAFFPISDFSPLVQLSWLQWSLLLFCCLNTVVAYGAFAEALHHWEASKVSAVLAITPLITILSANLVAWIWPTVISPQLLNTWSWIGAFLVMAGSALTALAPQFSQYRATRRQNKLLRKI